jgi:histidine triad (HIT) family protein
VSCLFCKIATGEIPSKTLFEDDTVKAFYDIEPKAPVHFLVIPKQHIASAAEINASNSAVVSHVYEVIALLAKEQKIENGFRVISNVGEDAGQTVKHLHFHVLGGRKLSTDMA